MSQPSASSELAWIRLRRPALWMVVLLLLLPAVMGLRVLHLKSGDPASAELHIYGKGELSPGLPAAFRIAVVDGKAQKPVTGAKVSVVLVAPDGKKQALFDGSSDETGLVVMQKELPADLGEGAYTLQVKANTSVGEAQLSRPVQLKRSFRTYLSTDKPLYQPGQTMHLRSLTLSSALSKPVADKDMVLEVQDGKGNKVFKKRVKTSSFGLAAADFVLADQVNTGSYTVSALIGDTSAQRTVNVERYVLPKFKMDLTTERGFYQPGEVIQGTLRADYTFGKPVTGGSVEITASEYLAGFEQFASSNGKTDATGRYAFSIPLQRFHAGDELHKGNAVVMLKAKLKDSAGHTLEKGLEVTVANEPLQLGALPESGELVVGVENRVYVIAAYPDGKPAEAVVKVKGPAVGLEPVEVRTAANGVGIFSVAPNQLPVELQLTAKDARGASCEKALTLGNPGLRGDLLLRPDKAIYRAGESLRLEVLSGTPSGRIFVDVVKDGRTMLMSGLDVQAGKGSLTLDLPADLVGTLEVAAYRLNPDGNLVQDVRLIQVNPAQDLQIAVSADREQWQPGEKAVLRFAVSRGNGEPVPAALSLAGVDEAVFALAESRPGLEKVYFALQEELLKPRYELHSLLPAPSAVLETTGSAGPQPSDVLLAAGSGGSVGQSRSTSYGSLVSEREGRIRDLSRVFAATLALLPTLWALLLFVPSLIYPLVRLFSRRPGEGTDAERAAFFRAARGLSWRLVAAVYGPLAVLAAGMAVVDEVPWGQRDFWRGGAVMLTLVVVVACARSLFRQTKAVKATALAVRLPVYMRLVARTPWLYLLLFGALGVLVGFLKAMDRHGDEEVVAAVLAGYLVLLLLHALTLWLGALVAEKPVSAARYVWLSLSRGAILWGAPALLLGVTFFGARMDRGPDLDMVRMKQELAPGAMPDRFMKMMAADESKKVEEGAGAGAKEGGLVAPTRVRRYFPETLFWTPELVTDAQGKASLEVPLADSITTWRVAASAVSQRGELGDTTAGLRVFQDFFVDIDFPVALTQNDRVSVPVSVFNYLKVPQKVRLEVQPAEWCRLLDGNIRELTIGPDQVSAVSIQLQALKPGRHSLLVKAYGTSLADAVEREVTVSPDGEAVVQTFNGQLKAQVDQPVEIPPEALDGANDLIVKIFPGSFSQVLEGMDNIFQMPYGCFEQTSSTTYPNVLVLDYLKRTKQARPEVELKALNFINLGYQRLLSYEVSGGGFEWFGHAPAHNVLTAYGLLELSDMAKVYEVDPAVLSRTRDYLYAQQKPDATWEPSSGGIAEGAINAFQGQTVRTTAYVVWALAESGEGADRLSRALDVLEARCADAENGKDAYTLAMCANALASSGRRAGAEKLMAVLKTLAVQEKDAVYWSSSQPGVTYSSGDSLSVETTALVAQALIKAQSGTDLAYKALAWIVGKKDPQGTWYSTQATVQAMRALLAGTGGGSTVEGEVSVAVKVRGETVQTLKINADNADVYHLISLREKVRKGRNSVQLTLDGKGSLAYQVVATHYRPWTGEGLKGAVEPLSISVRYDRTTVRRDALLGCTVKLTSHLKERMDMTLVDLGIPPGFEVQTDGLEALVTAGQLEKYTLTGKQITLYFRKLDPTEPISFTFKLRAKYPVTAKTPSSKVYAYYQPELKAQAQPVTLTIE